MSLRDYLFYEEPGITLYCGDCREVLPLIDRHAVDLVIADPPYGVGIAKWDAKPVDGWYDELVPVMRPDTSLFCFWSVSGLLEFPIPSQLVYERVLVWSKPMTFSSQRAGATWHWEPIFWWKRGAPRLTECVSDVIEVNPPLTRLHLENVAHPAQKPLELIQRLMVLGGGDTVLDPFVGSGTVLRAAKDLNRTAIGIEIEPKYCEIAVKRLRQEVLAL